MFNYQSEQRSHNIIPGILPIVIKILFVNIIFEIELNDLWRYHLQITVKVPYVQTAFNDIDVIRYLSTCEL